MDRSRAVPKSVDPFAAYRDAAGHVRADLMFDALRQARSLAEEIAGARDVVLERRNIRFLIDVQGIYLCVLAWMERQEIPLGDGSLLNRFAIGLLHEAIRVVRRKDQRRFRADGIDFEELVTLCQFGNRQELAAIHAVRRQDVSVDLFFAPAPLKDIEEQLCRQMERSPDPALQAEIARVRDGIVTMANGWGRRNYRHYDAFVAALEDWLDGDGSGRGFFAARPDRRGHTKLDEKEVDIRLAIRAMETLVDHDADTICIVSSDQDFLPLHERLRAGGIDTYHADVARFDRPDLVGRRIRALGEDAILPMMPRDLPMALINDFIGSPRTVELTAAQYGALFDLHWRMNPRRGP